MNKKIMLIFFIIILGIIIFQNKKEGEKTKQSEPQQNALQIISTNPSPLEGSTILPTQNIEITLNKPVIKSEFKYKLDPEVENDIQVKGNTIEISFKKPLPLGGGFTLFILSGTHTENGINLGEDKVFHFKTIKYNGV